MAPGWSRRIFPTPKRSKAFDIVRDGDLIAVLHAQPDLAEAALLENQGRIHTAEIRCRRQDHLRSSPEGGSGRKRARKRRGSENRGARSRIAFRSHLPQQLCGPCAHGTAHGHRAASRETAPPSGPLPRPRFGPRRKLREALGIPAENVRVISPFVGGGFGGKTRNLQVGEAARLARLTGKPVQVAWSRNEEFFYDSFRPAAVVKIRSGATAQRRYPVLGLPCLFRRRPRGRAILRHSQSPYGLLRRRLGRHSRIPSVRHRRLAGSGQQHQHLRPGIADRHRWRHKPGWIRWSSGCKTWPTKR